jgi:hypothetical protein
VVSGDKALNLGAAHSAPLRFVRYVIGHVLVVDSRALPAEQASWQQQIASAPTSECDNLEGHADTVASFGARWPRGGTIGPSARQLDQSHCH